MPHAGLEPATLALRIVFRNDIRELTVLRWRWIALHKPLARLRFPKPKGSTPYHGVAIPLTPRPYYKPTKLQ